MAGTPIAGAAHAAPAADRGVVHPAGRGSTVEGRWARLLAAVVAGLVATGCGAASDQAAAPTPSVVRCPTFDTDCVEVLPPDTIELRGIAFRPTELEVIPGAELTVHNLDPVDHTITAGTPEAPRSDLFDVALDPEAVATIRAPTTPGQVPYFCRVHPSMRGLLIIR